MKKFAKFIIIISIFINSFGIPLMTGVGYSQQTNIAYAVGSQVSKGEDGDHNEGGYLDCSWYDFACKGINFLQMIFVAGGNVLVGVSALFMDFFLAHSIQSSTYKDQSFVAQGWEIIRDMTNIVFIFALIVIAFNLVLGTGGSDSKRRLIKVIVVALMINFSLFATYVVIDVSNILGHVFYNKIAQNETTLDSDQTGTTMDNSANNAISVENSITGTSTSLEIAAKINPQKILDGIDATASKGQRIVVILMIGAINIALIYTFLSVSFLFLGRTIGLWISAVLVPLALASITIPGMDKWDYIGFSNWLKSFLKMAFMAPVFLFFLYLAVKFMGIELTYENDTGDFMKTLLSVVIPMGAVVTLILASKKVAETMSGDFAGTISGIVMKGVKGAAVIGGGAAAVGLSGGMALGGGISRGVGRAVGGQKTMAGRGLSKLGKRMGRTKTIDVTKIPGFKGAAKSVGLGGAASFFNKNIAGQSGLSARRKAETGILKATDGSGDGLFGSERGVAEAEYEHKKAKDKIQDGAQNWQGKLEKKKADDELKAAESAGKAAKREAEKEHETKVGKTLQDMKQKQQTAYEDLHQDGKHGEESKTLLGIEEELKKLNKQKKEEATKLKESEDKLGARPSTDYGKNEKEAADWDTENAKITTQKEAVKNIDVKIKDKTDEFETQGKTVSDMEKDYKEETENYENFKEELEKAGDNAKDNARYKHASNLSEGKESGSWEMETANKIIKGGKSKTTKEKILEELLDKIEEDKKE